MTAAASVMAAARRSCPVPTTRLAPCGLLVAGAIALPSLGALLVVAAAVLVLDGLLPHASPPALEAEDRFRRVSRRRRRHAAGRRLTGRPPHHLSVVHAAGASVAQRRTLGVMPIELASVTGTVEPAKARQFDGCFRPDRTARDRWRSLWTAQARGVALPPILVYRLGDEHVVVDGHHRVSVARDHGTRTIDAEVVVLGARV